MKGQGFKILIFGLFKEIRIPFIIQVESFTNEFQKKTFRTRNQNTKKSKSQGSNAFVGLFQELWIRCIIQVINFCCF